MFRVTVVDALKMKCTNSIVAVQLGWAPWRNIQGFYNCLRAQADVAKLLHSDDRIACKVRKFSVCFFVPKLPGLAPVPHITADVWNWSLIALRHFPLLYIGGKGEGKKTSPVIEGDPCWIFFTVKVGSGECIFLSSCLFSLCVEGLSIECCR